MTKRMYCVVPGCKERFHGNSRYCLAHTIESGKSWPEWRERYHEPLCVVPGCGEPREGPMSSYCDEHGKDVMAAWAASKAKANDPEYRQWCKQHPVRGWREFKARSEAFEAYRRSLS